VNLNSGLLVDGLGAIISGGKGTAADKIAALEAADVRVVQSPAVLGTAIKERMIEEGLVK